MIRKCDGKDETLQGVEGGACACGLTFDDAERMVLWPHRALLSRDEREQLRRLAEFVGRRSGEDVG